MKKEDALKVWLHEFGDVDYAHDYLVENQVGWVVSYIKPISLGGPDNTDNMIILNHNTAYEKAENYPDFEVVGVKYTIKYDSADDFYYIEKVLD